MGKRNNKHGHWPCLTAPNPAFAMAEATAAAGRVRSPELRFFLLFYSCLSVLTNPSLLSAPMSAGTVRWDKPRLPVCLARYLVEEPALPSCIFCLSSTKNTDRGCGSTRRSSVHPTIYLHGLTECPTLSAFVRLSCKESISVREVCMSTDIPGLAYPSSREQAALQKPE